jgi:hypothetical protein
MRYPKYLGFQAEAPKLAFQSFDLERTWWRLFQTRLVYIKYDIYVFIKGNYNLEIIEIQKPERKIRCNIGLWFVCVEA